MNKIPRPDWNVWANKDHLTPDEGALLTMDLCPNAFDQFENEFSWKGLPSLRRWAALASAIGQDNAEEFNERQGVLNIAFGNCLTLADVQTIGRGLGWSLPGALEVADTSETGAASPCAALVQLVPPSRPSQADEARPIHEEWELVEPQRFQGYREALYNVLRAAKDSGLPLPTPRDVLASLRLKRPPEIDEVLEDQMKYYDSNGNSKTATLSNIRKTIDRLVR